MGVIDGAEGADDAARRTGALDLFLSQLPAKPQVDKVQIEDCVMKVLLDPSQNDRSRTIRQAAKS